MAIETLRPNANGDLNQWAFQNPGTGSHWDKVDEEVADDNTTYVYDMAFDGDLYELYNLPSHSIGSGTINGITIYVRAKQEYSLDYFKISLKTGGNIYESDSTGSTAGSWGTVSWAQAINPKTSAAWTWDDIDSLQIGVNGNTRWTEGCVNVTQVYVDVDYTATNVSQIIFID